VALRARSIPSHDCDASGLGSLIAATAAVLALIGGYIQFVLKRSILPSLQFDTDFKVHGMGPKSTIGEVACTVTNTGTNIGVIENVRFRIRYRRFADDDVPYLDGLEPQFLGLLHDPSYTPEPEPSRTRRNSLWRWPRRRPTGEAADGQVPSPVGPTISLSGASPEVDFPTGPQWIFIVRRRVQQGGHFTDRTFIQPGVTQRYARPVYLPHTGIESVDLTAAFDYKMENGRITNWLIGIFARPPADLDWSRGIKFHTARRLISLIPPLPLVSPLETGAVAANGGNGTADTTAGNAQH
jgi:hypothetical protein